MEQVTWESLREDASSLALEAWENVEEKDNHAEMHQYVRDSVGMSEYTLKPYKAWEVVRATPLPEVRDAWSQCSENTSEDLDKTLCAMSDLIRCELAADALNVLIEEAEEDAGLIPN